MNPIAEESGQPRPFHVLEVELASPIMGIPGKASTMGTRYDRALLLVRLHSRPIGQIEIPIPEEGLTPREVARNIRDRLDPDISRHLLDDGISAAHWDEGGVVSESAPRCLQQLADSLTDAPLITVVVATRDRPDVLGQCVESLLAMEYPRFEILVIDNAPRTAMTLDLIRDHHSSERRIRYIREDRPGLSWARNRGIIEAQGTIIAFTDDDVVADRYWLTWLREGFRAESNVACVTGLVLPYELETAAQIWFEQFGGFGKGFERRIFDTGLHRPDTPLFPYAAGMFGSGNNMAFRLDALRAIGGFDPALGAGALAGGEDLDAFFRLITGGGTLVYEPAAIVYHRHRQDYVSLRRQLSDGGVVPYLTKHILQHPMEALIIAGRLPQAIRYLVSPRSGKNARKAAGYPRELTLAEWTGMARAPLAYLQSRRRAERIAREHGPLSVSAPASSAEKVGER